MSLLDRIRRWLCPARGRDTIVVNLSTYNGEPIADIVAERDALRAGISRWQHAIDCDWRTQNICTCGMSEARRRKR